MTQYVSDEGRRLLIATWETGHGQPAHTVAVLSPSTDLDSAMRLTESMTVMSHVAWRTLHMPKKSSVQVKRRGCTR